MNQRAAIFRFMSLTIVSAVISFAMAHPMPAGAVTFRQQQATGSCRFFSHPTNTYNSGEELNNGTGFNFMDVACPVVDNSNFQKQNYTALKVYANDASPSLSITASICVEYFDLQGGACGSAASSGDLFTGNVTLSVPLGSPSVFTSDTSDFGYVWIALPPPYMAAPSSIRGYRSEI